VRRSQSGTTSAKRTSPARSITTDAVIGSSQLPFVITSNGNRMALYALTDASFGM